jgi:peptide deformylase
MNNIKIKQLNERFSKILEECPELVYIGGPVLRSKTEEVGLEEGLEIAERLKKVLRVYRGITGIGRGLAAPQVGLSKAVFVTYVGDVFKTYLNPKILIQSEGMNFYRESCLSCGYLSVDVKRPESIEIKYLNEAGELIHEKADSFLARLLQHEYDHLEGIVNIDKAEPASIEFAINDPLKEELRKLK